MTNEYHCLTCDKYLLRKEAMHHEKIKHYVVKIAKETNEKCHSCGASLDGYHSCDTPYCGCGSQ